MVSKSNPASLGVCQAITPFPLCCVDYVQSGVAHDGAEKSRENYTAKVVYEKSSTSLHTSFNIKL